MRTPPRLAAGLLVMLAVLSEPFWGLDLAAGNVARAAGDGQPVFADGFESPPVPDGCPEDWVPPLEGATRNWGTEPFPIFSAPFPGPKSDLVLQRIPKSGYLAIRFDTGATLDTGTFSTIESTLSGGTRLGAISECPGDFDVVDSCKCSWGIGCGIVWSTDGAPNGCPLKNFTTYYVNVTFTDGFSAASDTCTESACYTQLRVNNPDYVSPP